MAYTHGTSGYINYACRCPACTKAWANYIYDLRGRRADNRVLVDGVLVSPVGEHGRDNTYVNHLCRCAPCTQAHAAAARRRYHSARAS